MRGQSKRQKTRPRLTLEISESATHSSLGNDALPIDKRLGKIADLSQQLLFPYPAILHRLEIVI